MDASARLHPAQATPKTHLPGEVGVWVFIFGDLMVFGLLFATYAFYRGVSAESVELFRHSQTVLNTTYGVINTLLLLTSSWFVAMGVNSARAKSPLVSRFLILGIVCGLGFIGMKVLEYSEKIHAGITIATNDFYMYYYILTGLHLLHVTLGLGVLTYLYRRTRGRAANSSDISVLESGACFWHMVDLLWIVLFPLLYLMK